jgi:hypothetical protein
MTPFFNVSSLNLTQEVARTPVMDDIKSGSPNSSMQSKGSDRELSLGWVDVFPMRSLLATLFVFVFGVATYGAAPDALEGGTSPTKRHEVVLDAAPETPVLLVREIPSHRIVGRLEWPGDPSGGDTQPLRTHAKVLWQPGGAAVAINTDERFYAYTSVLARQPKSGRFVQVQFPDYKTLTGFPSPNFDHLRPRGFARSLRWTPKGHLVYVISYAPDASYDAPDPLNHRITLSVTPTGMKVIRRESNPEDG